MTRPTRMLLAMAVFSIAAVVVLGMMASRYSALLDARSTGAVASTGSRPTATSAPAPDPPAHPDDGAEHAEEAPALTPAEEADRFVDAFIAVRRALREAEQGTELPGLLRQHGLDEADYLKLEKLYRAWKAGRRDPRNPILAAFERHRDELP